MKLQIAICKERVYLSLDGLQKFGLLYFVLLLS